MDSGQSASQSEHLPPQPAFNDPHTGNSSDQAHAVASAMSSITQFATLLNDIAKEMEESRIVEILKSLKASDDRNRKQDFDAPSEEMSQNARIWTVYLDEAKSFDEKMLHGWNRSIDVLLVFAGLFSAVLTTFLIQTVTSLSPDPSLATNAILADIAAVLNNGTAGNSAANAAATFTPSTSVRWINSLWFLSLGLALSSALISMLAKQWLQSYSPKYVGGSSRDQARSRQALFSAFQAWHVGVIIDAMPCVLHISLLLFFAGLVIFVWVLDRAVAIATTLAVGVASLFYLITLILPIVSPDCPYSMPALHDASIFRSLSRSATGSALLASLRAHLNTICEILHVWPRRRADDASNGSIAKMEMEKRDNALLDLRSLAWLLTVSTDRSVQEALLHAMGGLPLRYYEQFYVLSEAGVAPFMVRMYNTCEVSPHGLKNPRATEIQCRAVAKLSWAQDLSEYFAPLSAPMAMSAYLPGMHDQLSDFGVQMSAVAQLLWTKTFPQYRERSLYLRYLLTDYISEREAADISIRVFLLDSFSRYLAQSPLWPSHESGGEDDAEFSQAVMSFILAHLDWYQEQPLSEVQTQRDQEELQLASAHALFCSICTTDPHGYRWKHRFDPDMLPTHILDGCSVLLQSDGWFDWLNDTSRCALVIHRLCGALLALNHPRNPGVTSSIDPHRFMKAMRILWSRLGKHTRLNMGSLDDATLSMLGLVLAMLPAISDSNDVSSRNPSGLVADMSDMLTDDIQPLVSLIEHIPDQYLWPLPGILTLALKKSGIDALASFILAGGIRISVARVEAGLEVPSVQSKSAVRILALCAETIIQHGATVDPVDHAALERLTQQSNALCASDILNIFVRSNNIFNISLGYGNTHSRWHYSTEWLALLTTMHHLRPEEPLWVEVRRRLDLMDFSATSGVRAEAEWIAFRSDLRNRAV